MSNRNRTAGHDYERKIVRELTELGYSVKTSRYASREMDDLGIDIVGDFPFRPQVKKTSATPSVKRYIENGEADIIFWARTERSNKNIVTKGEYVIIRKEDFYDLFRQSKKLAMCNL